MNAHGKCKFLGFQNSSSQTNYNSEVKTSANDLSNSVEEKGT